MNSRWQAVSGSHSPRIAFDVDKIAGLTNSDDFDTDMSSPHSSTLSDVPEESSDTPSKSTSKAPYIHAGNPAIGSTSTFAVPIVRNGSAPAAHGSTSLPSSLSQSQLAGPSSHRTSPSLRRSSSRSLHRTLTESAAASSGNSTNPGQSLRRNTSNGSASSLSAITTLGTRSPRIPPPLPSAASSSTAKDPPRTRTTPRLPHDKDARPAPSTAMHWSKAPAYGAMLNRSVRSHSVTLVDTAAWLFGGCDDHDSARDIYCFDIGVCPGVIPTL